MLESGDQAIWFSSASTLRVEFDANRCPFPSNIMQAPAGVQMESGPVRAGMPPGSYRYKLFMNDNAVGQGEIIVRAR